MYIDVGLIVPCGSEFHNFKIFRTFHRKWGIGKKQIVAKMHAHAHNNNKDNSKSNTNKSSSNDINKLHIVTRWFFPLDPPLTDEQLLRDWCSLWLWKQFFTLPQYEQSLLWK